MNRDLINSVTTEFMKMVQMRIGEDIIQYTDVLIDIVTELAMKYFVVVNALCVPYKEYEEKKSWYDFFVNIEREGPVIYG